MDNSNDPQLQTIRNFLLNAPPGEFNEVANDVRELVQNDQLLKSNSEYCFVSFSSYYHYLPFFRVFSQYNKELFTACKLPNVNEMVLITDYNDLGGGRFFDPKSKHSFKYDHLKREASDIEPFESPATDLEMWRGAVEVAMHTSVLNRYPQGIVSTFSLPSGHKHLFNGSSDTSTAKNLPSLVSCIESHLYQPKNFWNGKWRSQWIVTPTADLPFQSGSTVEVTGKFHIQVHYFEEGNIQLICTKEVRHSITLSVSCPLVHDFFL